MKKTIRLRSFLALAGSAVLAISSANAAVYYWDSNGITAGWGTAAGGIWAEPTASSWTTGTNSTTNPPASRTILLADSVNFGDGSANTLTGGTITVTGNVDATNITFGSSAGQIILDGGIITLAATASITVNNATDTITSEIADAATSLTKSGSGILVLTGANSYTGSTIINDGILALDYVTQNNSKLSNAGVLTLGGGTIQLTGASGNHTEVVASTTLTAGTAFSVTRSGANTAVLQLGTITNNTGATINFGEAGIATTNNTNNSVGILGSWATLGGNSWAINSTNGANGSITAYTGYVDVTRLDSGTKTIADSSVHYRIIEGTGLTGDITMAAGGITSINTLVNTATTAGTVDIGTGNTLRTSAILQGTGAGVMTIGVLATPGTLTALTAGGDLAVNANAAITINSTIDNHTSASSLTKYGTGTLTFSGANTYTGVTTLAGGTLSVATIGNGGVAGNLGQATNVAGNLVFGGGTLDYTGANATSDRAFTIIAGRTATINTANNLSLVGATGSATTGALTKTGAGILTLSGANSYSGVTTVSGGTLSLTGSLIGASLGNVVVEATGTLGVSGTGTLTGSATTTSLIYGTTAGVSTVNISTGANISLFATTGANVAGAVSIWNQTGGAVTLTNGVADGRYLANTGYGYMNLSGGSFSTGRFSVANHTGTTPYAVARIGGGAGTATFSSPSDILFVARGAATIGELTVLPNGIVDHNGASDSIILVGNGNAATGFLNIVGGTVKSDTTSIQIGNGRFSVSTVSMTNLGSGSLEIGKSITFDSGGPGVGFFNKAYVNFAGGTVKVTVSGITTMLLPATDPKFDSLANTIFGAVTNSTANNNGTGGNSGIFGTVGTTQDFTGGVTIHTNTLDATISGPLVAPTGGGVAQGNLSVTGGSGYSGPPVVVFSSPTAANATPAAGYAIISGGAVTGIVITAPGSYASGDTVSVTLSGGGGSGASVANIVGSSLTANTSGGLTKTGTGTLTLGGSNSYTGVTTVSAGTLLVNGSLNVGSAVTVTAGSLGGTGTISGTVTIGNGTGTADAILAPGTSIDSIDTGNLSFLSDGSYAVELDGTLVTTDVTNVTGTVAINAATTLTVNVAGSLSASQQYVIVANDAADPVTGTFFNLVQGATVGNFGGTNLKISYIGGDGNDIVLYTESTSASAYDTWKAANALGSNPDDDTDGDGVSNAVEFVLGGTTPTNDLGKLPVVSDDGTNVVFTFFRAQSSIDPKTGLSIEVGTDLATWTAPSSPYAVPDIAAASNPGVTVEKNNPAAGTDKITLRVVKSPDPKKFARLKVVITP